MSPFGASTWRACAGAKCGRTNSEGPANPSQYHITRPVTLVLRLFLLVFMNKSCGKHKRGERGSTEDTLSSPKRANMASEQLSDDEATEPTNQELKEMFLDIKSQITNVLLANNKLTKEMENLKSEVKSQRTEIVTLKASLVTSKNANEALKTAWGQPRKKLANKENKSQNCTISTIIWNSTPESSPWRFMLSRRTHIPLPKKQS